MTNPKTSNRYPLLYLGYGANTNRDHMKRRCPTAVYLGNAELLDYRLVFRSVADVIPVKGQMVVCAMWAIQQPDERALDMFEGYPNFYRKDYATIKYRGRERTAMFYIMNGPRKDRYEPSQGYEHTLREGYRQCGMPADQIDAAIFDALKSQRRKLQYRGKWLDPKDRAKVDAERAASRPITRTPSYSGLAPARPASRRDDDLDVLRNDEGYPSWFTREYFNDNGVF